MSFMTQAVTGIGGRNVNEDSFGFLEMNQTACWIVADGLGGHRGGEIASKVAVDAALASFRAIPELSSTAIARHLEAAQQAVMAEQKKEPSLSTMRTTIVMLLSDGLHALWGHAGDTRLYCLENGRIVLCTRDHSVVQAMVTAGELPANRIRHHEDRNKLLRTLGGDGDFRPTIESEPRDLNHGASFLLCTDGFWEDVIEEEIETDYANAASTRDWLASMQTRLSQRSTENSDNYTAIAVMFNAQDAAAGPPPRKKNKSAFGRISGTASTTIVIIAIALVIWHGWERLHALDREVAALTAQRDALQKQNESQESTLSHLQQQLNAAQGSKVSAPEKTSPKQSAAPKTSAKREKQP